MGTSISVIIFLVLRKGFQSIHTVSQAVSKRKLHDLTPIKVQHIPIEIKPIITALNQLFGRLQIAFEKEERFSADAAHELRTPLAALKTQLQVAENSTSLVDKQNAINKTLQAVDRCTHIVEQLLTLSRINPDPAKQAMFKIVHLGKLTQEITAELSPLALNKNIEIVLALAETSLTLQGNEIALGILIRNLLANAINHTPRGGKIKIDLRLSHQEIVFTITDNGPGIPPDLRKRVLERFYRVVGQQHTGSGLGLAIVNEIAKLHQATLKLQSNPSSTGLKVVLHFAHFPL